MYEKIRYKKRKQQAKKPLLSGKEIENEIGEADEKEIEDLITFFQNCVLPRDEEEVLNKMRASAKVRKISNQNNRDIFDKSFHLYRVNSELVSLRRAI